MIYFWANIEKRQWRNDIRYLENVEYLLAFIITRGIMIMTEVIRIFLRRNNTKMEGKSFKKYFQVHLDWSDLWSLAGEKVYRLIPRDIGHRTLSQYSVQRAPGKKLYTLSIYFESLLSENTSIGKGRRNTDFRSFFRWMSLSSKKDWPRHFSIPNLGLDPKRYIQKVDQNIDLLGTISMASFGLAGWVIFIGLFPNFF